MKGFSIAAGDDLTLILGTGRLKLLNAEQSVFSCMLQYLLTHRIILKEGQDFYFVLTVDSHNGQVS